MGPLGIPELVLIFIVALIVFGPKKLPEVGRTVGRALSMFRKASSDLQTTIQRELHLEEYKALDLERLGRSGGIPEPSRTPAPYVVPQTDSPPGNRPDEQKDSGSEQEPSQPVPDETAKE